MQAVFWFRVRRQSADFGIARKFIDGFGTLSLSAPASNASGFTSRIPAAQKSQESAQRCYSISNPLTDTFTRAAPRGAILHEQRS
jgi:hypothetical protein